MLLLDFPDLGVFRSEDDGGFLAAFLAGELENDLLPLSGSESESSMKDQAFFLPFFSVDSGGLTGFFFGDLCRFLSLKSSSSEEALEVLYVFEGFTFPESFLFLF